MFHFIEKMDIRSRPIFGGRAIKWGLIIAYLWNVGYLVQSVQGKVNTVEHLD